VNVSSVPAGNFLAHAEDDRQNSPLPCICSTLRRASRAVTNLYDLVLAPSGLRVTQFLVLKALHERGRIAQCDFARDQDVAVETLTRRFGALRRKGLVEMRLGERHGERIYSLTAEGRRAFVAALPYWERAQERLHNVLGASDTRTLLDICERVRQAAHSAESARAKNQVDLPSLEKYAGVTAD
jgi:DNA-binding MarR family transcriptional regulator